MRNAQVNIYDVEVIFDALHHSFSFEGDLNSENLSIPVAVGVQMINFTLLTVHHEPSTSGATFQFYPIEWIGAPDLVAARGAVGEWFDSTHCRLVVFNSNTSTAGIGYSFIMTVMFDGVAYSTPDPTIINEPPVQH